VDLLVQFSVPADDGASVILINGRSTGSEQILEDGDIVAVFPAMAGG
jgi:molybdopterin converting factor small subunit